MTRSGRLQREQEFHDTGFVGEQAEHEHALKHYAITRRQYERYIEIIAGLCKDKALLEYGCGTGRG